ncbi:MAG: PilZ domain-containing protein, partial [Candidatus Omnitrophota bacterium]
RICKDREIAGTSLIENVSRGGIRFLLSKKLERGTLIALKMLLPNENPPIFITGEITWAKGGNGGSLSPFDTGVKFAKISELDKVRLLDFAYTRWLNRSNNNRGI